MKIVRVEELVPLLAKALALPTVGRGNSNKRKNYIKTQSTSTNGEGLPIH